jgi:hypothetical protein
MFPLKNSLKLLPFCFFASLLTLPAFAATEIELKIGQSQSTVLYTYNRDTCAYGPLGTIDIKNPENGVITTSKSNTKVDNGAYCLGKTMKGWKVTLKATSKGKSCGYVAITAPDLNGSAIGSTRYPFCLTVK